MVKHKFESAYPLEAEVYFQNRFKNEGLTPFKVTKCEVAKSEIEYELEQGLELIKKAQKNDPLIHLYHFEISEENVLTETLFMDDWTRFQLHTSLDDIESFFHIIFPMMGVLLYGTIDKGKRFITRDDVCCEFAHEVYPKHTELKATWWDDEPYINHFFAFHSSKYPIDNDCVAIGGEPLGRGSKAKTSATFYLMKAITRNGKEAYIKASDDMKTVYPFEQDIVKQTIEGLKKQSVLTHEIIYQVD